MELAPGAFVTPQIRLRARLRRGGMGSVWAAEHLALRAEVVVKFMSDELAADPASLARFSREASAAAQVRSPHVVQVLDHGVTDDGRPFIVMELLEGKDLAQVLRERLFSPAETALIVEHVARALSRAHERGILHRDIKPANIFLCDVGASEPFVKLIDFGIAKGTGGEVTGTGDVIGTPQYMSPEQLASARDIDLRADLWSVGVVAYRCLTGATPFEGDSVASVALKVVSAPLPRPSSLRADLTPAIDAWFVRALARDPSQRFASAREMADALSRAVSPNAVVAQAISAPLPAPARAEHDTTVRGLGGDTGQPAKRKLGALMVAIGLMAVAILVLSVRLAMTRNTVAAGAPSSGLSATGVPHPPDPNPVVSADVPHVATVASSAPVPMVAPTVTATASASAAPKARPNLPRKAHAKSTGEPDDGF